MDEARRTLKKVGLALRQVEVLAEKMRDDLEDENVNGEEVASDYRKAIYKVQYALKALMEIDISIDLNKEKNKINQEVVSISGDVDTGFFICLDSFATENDPAVRAKTDYYSLLLRSAVRNYMIKHGHDMPCFECAEISFGITVGRDRKMVDLDNILTKYLIDALEGVMYKSDSANCLVRQNMEYLGEDEKSEIHILVKEAK